MVSYAQLRDMDLSNINTAAGAAGTLSSDLSSRGEEVHDASDIDPAIWNGTDSGAAETRLAAQPPSLYDASDAFHYGQAALEDLADGIGSAQEHLEGAHELVAGTPVSIDDSGRVSYPPPLGLDSEAAREYIDDNDAIARQAREIIDEALEMAEEADDAAVTAINSNAGSDGGSDDIPVGGDAEEVNEWWEGLSGSERQELIEEFPEIIGNLDGVPSEARDEANRITLENTIEDLEGRSDLTGDEQTQLDELRAVAGQLDEYDDTYLLGLVPDEGQAAIAIGNPDTADNVFTLVPGATTTLSDLDLSLDERVNDILDDTEGNTAGVVWLGYDPPSEPMDTFDPDSFDASGAGSDLSDFQRGLEVTSENGAHTTVIGHSAGAVVAGHAAAEHDMSADNLAILGAVSPIGAGSVDDFSGIDQTYVAGAQDRMVGAGGVVSWPRVPGLQDPLPHAPWFGAESLDGNNPFNTHGHSEYWSEDERFRDQIVDIVEGNGPTSESAEPSESTEELDENIMPPEDIDSLGPGVPVPND